MPGMSGLQLQEAMQERDITLPLIILSGVDELQTAVRAMRSGAVDFIQKPCSSQELLDRINEAIAQDEKSRKGDATSQDVQEAFAALTDRERQVMECVVEGKANKVIAYDLGISEKTVEVHRGRVMQKLNVGSVAELVRIVLTGQRLVS